MSHLAEQYATGGLSANNLHQMLASEARLSRLHRLFKTQFNVTEPSMILEPYLFLGNCISAQDIHRLAQLGIRYILNVAVRDVELCPYYANDMRTLTVDLRDDDRENILRTFDQTFAFIDEAKRNKSRVLVHCSHGQSRSPAIVIGYLMRTYDVSLEQCLVHVVKARPCVLPNDGFLKQLILYDRFLVDRRRRREEAAVAKIINAAPLTEIPIQRQTPVALERVRSKTPVEVPTKAKISSVDSAASLQPSSAASVISSISGESIQVVPIQIPLQKPRSAQTEPTPMKMLPGEEKRNAARPSREMSPRKSSEKRSHKSKIEVTQSNHKAPSKSRHSALITNIVGRPSTRVPRSHSARVERTVRVQPVPYPYVPIQNWMPYQSTSSRIAPNPPQSQYITEIYDKTTKRFVPSLS